MTIPNWYAAVPSRWADYLYQTVFILGFKTFLWNGAIFGGFTLLFLAVRSQIKHMGGQPRKISRLEGGLLVLWLLAGLFYSPAMFMGGLLIAGYAIVALARTLRQKAAPHDDKSEGPRRSGAIKGAIITEIAFIGLVVIAGAGLLLWLWLRYSKTMGLALTLGAAGALIVGIVRWISKARWPPALASLAFGAKKGKIARYCLIVFDLACIGLFLGTNFIPLQFEAAQPADASGFFGFSTMTFNIRNAGAAEKDAQDNWANRKVYVLEYIQSLSLGFFGVQEAYLGQLEFLRQGLGGGYEYTGVGRDDGVKGGEHAAIFFDSGRFDFIAGDTFWLSPTPNIPSKQWEPSNCRICTWALFETHNSHIRFFVFNTHFPEPKYPEAQEKAMKLLCQQVASISSGLPVIVMGDFNMVNTSAPYQYMTAGAANPRPLADSYVAYHNGTTPFDYTNNQFGNVPENEKERIDYIFVSGQVTVAQCTISKATYEGGRYYSDHFPVLLEGTISV